MTISSIPFFDEWMNHDFVPDEKKFIEVYDYEITDVPEEMSQSKFAKAIHLARLVMEDYYGCDDDEEDVLNDLVGCRYSHDQQGRDIYDLTDEEWNRLYQSVPWVDCIVVHITT